MGVRLPRRLDGATYAWGEELTPAKRWMANTWQGEFPIHNTRADGHSGTAPVGSYPPNDYGLYDMIGNVWERTSDWYQPHSAAITTCSAPTNPRFDAHQQSYDPHLPQVAIPRRVMKGGSHLGAPNYCQRYRPAARMRKRSTPEPPCFRCIVRGVITQNSDAV